MAPRSGRPLGQEEDVRERQGARAWITAAGLAPTKRDGCDQPRLVLAVPTAISFVLPTSAHPRSLLLFARPNASALTFFAPTVVHQNFNDLYNLSYTMRSFAAVLAFAASALAVSVTAPTNATGWATSGQNTVSWTAVSTDPKNFTIVLVNKASTEQL